VIHGLVHASVLLLPSLLSDLPRAFQVSLLDVLAVANLMYLVFGIAAIPAGYLADRVGSRRMLIIAACGCGGSLVLVALAQSFVLLGAGLVLLGASAGVYHPSGFSLLSRGVASRERGRAIGIHGVGGNFGEAIAPAWAALFAARYGWRAAFLSAAVLALACAALALSLPDAKPAPLHHAHPHPHTHPHPHSAATFRATLAAFGETLRSFWDSRPLRWLLLSMIASGFVYRGVLTFLPMHLASQGAATNVTASYLTSIVLLAGLVAQWFGGALADRLPRERLLLALVVLFVPVLFLLALSSGVGLVAMALCFGFLWYLAQPVANALTAAHADSRHHGLLYGVQFAATFGVGSFATSLGGLLVAKGGTRLCFLAFGAVAIVQVVGAVALVHSVQRPAAAVERAT
jgi:MFS family permease